MAQSHHKFKGMAYQSYLYDRLADAAYLGDIKKVSRLLAQGANPNLMPSIHIRVRQHYDYGDRYSPLGVAALQGRFEIVALLLKHGALVNQPDAQGDTPISWAEGSPKMTAFLLHHGANINGVNRYGETALNQACWLVDESNDDWQAEIALLLSYGAKVDTRDNEGSTPLMRAAETNSVKTMKLLIAHGANVNAVDKYGKTPLMHAANYWNTSWRESKPDAAEVLLEHKAHVNTRDKCGNTALMWLAQTDDTRGQQPDAVQFAQLLLTHGARVDLRNKRGKSALDLAKHSGLGDLVTLLEKHSKHNVR